MELPWILGVGSAHHVSDQGEDRPRPLATLWLPDPEQRHGWREFYVYPEHKPNRKPMGFRKR